MHHDVLDFEANFLVGFTFGGDVEAVGEGGGVDCGGACLPSSWPAVAVHFGPAVHRAVAE